MHSFYKLTGLFLAGCIFLTACGPKDSVTVSTAESATAETATGETAYSATLDDNGYYTGIKATDYVQLPDDYDSISVPAEYGEVSEESIDNNIHELTINMGTATQITDHPAAEGDAVTIDFVGTVNGVEFDGGSATSYVLELGSGDFIAGFEDQIIGHNVGETFDVNVTFPDGYGQTTDAEGNTIDLSGANAVFTTTLNDIAVYSLTNSDVAKAFEGYTLDDGSIIDSVDKARTYFEQYARYESVVSYLADYLMTNSVFTEDIPDEIVENEFEMEETYITELAANNDMTVNEILQSGGYDDMDAYLEASEEYIRQDLQYCFIIQAIAEKLDIEVTEKDIESSYGADADSAVATYGKGYVAQQVLTYLVMDELYTNAQIG